MSVQTIDIPSVAPYTRVIEVQATACNGARYPRRSTPRDA